MVPVSLGIWIRRKFSVWISTMRFGMMTDSAAWMMTPPPRWLANDNVREGIAALLDHDQCEEEWEHLGKETITMQRWLHEETMNVQAALQACQGEFAVSRLYLSGDIASSQW